MLYLLRATCVIGAIAWFSPVHEQAAADRLSAMRALPADMTSTAARHAPVEHLLSSDQGRALALRLVSAAVTAKDQR
jgi:hypothetical protein